VVRAPAGLRDDGNNVTLEAANEFSGVWLKDNYLSLLRMLFAIAAGRQLQVKFKIAAGNRRFLPRPRRLQSKPKLRTRSRAPDQQRTAFQSQKHL